MIDDDETISLLALFFLVNYSLLAYIAYEAFTAWLIFKTNRELNDNDKL